MDYRRWLRLRPQTADEVAREIDEELETHVALRAADLERAGVSDARARQQARQRFGDYQQARLDLIQSARQRHGRQRRAEWLHGLRQDVQYAFRRARHQPGPTIGSILLLALAIGLTTAVFTLVNSILFRALPFPEPDRLFAVSTQDSAGQSVPSLSMANWVDWRAQSKTVEAGALWQALREPIGTEADAVRATVTGVTGDFFRAVQLPLLMGRQFTHEEAQSGQSGVVVSEGFWRSVLGARPLPLTIRLGSRTREVIGIVRAGHEYPANTEIWRALREEAGTGMVRNYINYTGVIRLAAGVAPSQATDELNAISQGIRTADPAALYLWGVELQPLRNAIIGDAGTYLPILMGAVLFVLLIACANLAGMNVARGSARRSEMAVRASLGAGRARLLRQLLIEQLLIAAVGGALGIWLAQLSINTAVASSAGFLPRLHEIRMDPGVLLFALGITLLSGLTTGIIPALQLSRAPLRTQMATARGGIRGGRGLPGATLVGLEVAAAVILLIGATLLVRSYQSLMQRDLGYDTENVITAEIVLPRHRFPDPEQSLQYWDRLLSELRATPDVVAAGLATWIPMGGGATTFVEAEHNARPNTGGGYRIVGDDYFRALGFSLRAGRPIERTDDRRSPRVALVNESMAKMLWPRENAVGRRLRTPVMEGGPGGAPPAPWLTVVGVVADVRHWGIDQEVMPELYVSYRQVPLYASSMTAVVRVSRNPAQMVATVRNVLRQVDTQVPADIGTMDDRLATHVQTRKAIMTILTVFGSVALVLAALGLYSLLAFAVSQRTREIAIRIAIGADQRALVRLVFGNALVIVAIGAGAGLVAALGLTRFLERLLVGVRPLDPITLAVVPLLLLSAGALAAYLPARRAASLSPLTALRAD